MRTVTIETPSRLHFGLIDLHGGVGRIDGSIGLALERPRYVLRATPSRELVVAAEEPYRTRAAVVAKQAQAAWGVGGATFTFDETIPAHSGLGSGTQLTLAVFHAIAALYDVPLTREEAARLSGRGGASGIGVHAFYEGGFLVDGGHRYPEQKSEFLPSAASDKAGVGPLLWRMDFPEWDILVVVPNARQVSGDEEVRLFQTLCPMLPESAAYICHRLVMGLLPALVERDLAAFGSALEAIQSAGWKQVEIRAQDIAVRKTMDFLRENGAQGVAMSSWGPAVAAFGENMGALTECAAAYVASLPEGGAVTLTRANNHGAWGRRQ
jgi:beta-ribofuranosylaminobenzene 5'-phosphate synthase